MESSSVLIVNQTVIKQNSFWGTMDIIPVSTIDDLFVSDTEAVVVPQNDQDIPNPSQESVSVDRQQLRMAPPTSSIWILLTAHGFQRKQ